MEARVRRSNLRSHSSSAQAVRRELATIMVLAIPMAGAHSPLSMNFWA
jgi:hypothetical protein